jgi:hypothetical protein
MHRVVRFGFGLGGDNNHLMIQAIFVDCGQESFTKDSTSFIVDL